jgi:hypothetical protein
MALEHVCPACVPAGSRPRALRPERRPSSAVGLLTFTCGCGSAATVSTASGPGHELARLGWTFRFVAN